MDNDKASLEKIIAKLSPSLSFSWAGMVFILNFTPPTPEK